MYSGILLRHGTGSVVLAGYIARTSASKLGYHTWGMSLVCMDTELHMQCDSYCIRVDALCMRTQMFAHYEYHCLRMM